MALVRGKIQIRTIYHLLLISSLLSILGIIKEHLTFTSNTPAAIYSFVLLFSSKQIH